MRAIRGHRLDFRADISLLADHDADEDGAGRHRAGERVDIDEPAASAEEGDAAALRLELAADVQTDLCSVATVIDMAALRRSGFERSLIARLLDSLAPLVKMISPGFALISAALGRAPSRRRHAPPAPCVLPAGRVAEPFRDEREHVPSTRGIEGVVA